MPEEEKHLHLIRENPPTSEVGISIHPVFCEDCDKLVYVVHFHDVSEVR